MSTSDVSSGASTVADRAVIRALLNEWDVIGVVPHGVLDEYDCLLPQLAVRLDRGDGAGELTGFLRAELRDHFGLRPVGVETFVARLVAATRRG